MTAFRAPLRRAVRARTAPVCAAHAASAAARVRAHRLPRAVASLAAACCLCALPAVQVAAAAGGRPGQEHDSSDTAAISPSPSSTPGSTSSASPAGGALLDEPGVQVLPHPGAPDLPSDLSALSWTVSDARSGQVLAAKNAHRPLPPASTLKTLFADTVLPRFPGDRTHKVTDADLQGTGEGSSLVGVQAGQTYTVADLWRGVFLASGNDAVHVLAHMNGSVAQTVAQMQAKARMLGANDTHVVTPDGYDEPGQVSSAYDLAVFARAGLQNPDFATYCSTKSAQFPGGYDAHGSYVTSFGIRNTNRLLSGANGVTPYPGLIGVKNGYTTNAGNTLIAAAKHGSRTMIVTVMNPQSGLPQAVYNEAAKLLDWGFAAAGRTTSVGTLNTAGTALVGNAPAKAALSPGRGPAPARAQPGSPTTARSATASPTAWYVGGGLAVIAALSVLVLRRRGATKS